MSNSQRPSILTANPSQASRDSTAPKKVAALLRAPESRDPVMQWELVPYDLSAFSDALTPEMVGTLLYYPCDQRFDRQPLARSGELTPWFLDDKGELSGLLAYLRISDPTSWGKVMAFRRFGAGYLLGRWVVLEEQFDRLLVIPSRKVAPAKELNLLVLGSSQWIY